MKETVTYDYLIVGAGAAGLMLANAMALDAFFYQKKILILDPDPKEHNDRTWCFWEKNLGPLEPLIGQQWNTIGVSNGSNLVSKSIAPYKYKMLQSAPFYAAMKKQIGKAAHIKILQEKVLEIKSPMQSMAFLEVKTSNNSYKALKVFDSRFNYQPLLSQKKYPVLQQHFIGWFVQTKEAVFNKNEALFMDFSIPQQRNTRFMYLLPTSPTEALLEYTLFSKKPLEQQEYESGIKDYLKQLGVSSYAILDKETGSIPMTCYPFHKNNTAAYMKIGTAGGWSKASTGFTFKNTQKKTAALISFLKTNKSLETFHKNNRFWFYDLVLLEVLSKNNGQGKIIFEGLFKKRPAPLILKFLAEETNFLEELYIMSAANTWQFTKAFFRVIFRGL